MTNTFPLKQVTFVVTKIAAGDMPNGAKDLYKNAEIEANARIQELAIKHQRHHFTVLDISDFQINETTLKTRIVYQYDVSYEDPTVPATPKSFKEKESWIYE